jgi:hypothetical protein
MAMAAVLVFGTSLAARAAEAMDHAAIAAQYEQEAKDARAKVDFHKNMEKQYDAIKVSNPKSGLPNLNTMKNHCGRLINEYTEVANDADALAKEHRAAAAAAK